MSDALTKFRAARQPTDGWNDYYNAVVLSPVGGVFFWTRAVISFITTALLLTWDFIVACVAALLEFITNLPLTLFILALMAGFVALYIWWGPTINFTRDHLMPVVQQVFDVFRLIWNVFGLVVARLLLRMYNAMAPVLLFLLDILINYGVTVIEALVEVLGELDLHTIFEALMDIVIALINLVLVFIRFLIAISPQIINVMAVVIGKLLKLFIYLLYVIIPILVFLLVIFVVSIVVLFAPLIAIIAFFAWLFGRGNSSEAAKYTPEGDSSAAAGSRMLLNVATEALFGEQPFLHEASVKKRQQQQQNSTKNGDGNKDEDDAPWLRNSRTSNSLAGLFFGTMYESAMQQHTLADWYRIGDQASSLSSMVSEHAKYTVSASGHTLDVDDVTPNYDRVLFNEEEQDYSEAEHDYADADGAVAGDGGEYDPNAEEDVRNRRELLSEEDYEEYRSVDDEDNSTQPGLKDASDKPSYSASSNAAAAATLTQFSKWHKQTRSKHRHHRTHTKVNLKEHRRNMSKSIDPSGKFAFLIDHSASMEPHEVFPGLKTKSFKRVRLTEELVKTDKHNSKHHQRLVHASAWDHAIKTGVRHVVRRHVRNGQLKGVISDSFQHLTGHDNLHSLVKTYRERWASPRHMVNDLWPIDWNSNSWLRAWRDSDPNFAEAGHFHDRVRAMGFEDGKLPRWVYEKHEELLRQEDAKYEFVGGADAYAKHKQDPLGEYGVGFAHDDGLPQQQLKYMYTKEGLPVSQEQWHKRQPLADRTIVDLRIVYQGKSCRGTGASYLIICIPEPPWDKLRIPEVNLTAVFQIDYLVNSTSEATTFVYQDGNVTQTKALWHDTTCYFCLDSLWNTWVSIRFLVYWVDLFIFGIVNIWFPFVRLSVGIGLLGKTFPPLDFLTDRFLLYPIGTWPPRSHYILFFRYIGYLVVLFGVIYLYNRLFKWLQNYLVRFYNGWRGWWGTLRSRLGARNSLIEAADENLLNKMMSSYYRTQSRTQYIAERRGDLPIMHVMQEERARGMKPPTPLQQPIGDVFDEPRVQQHAGGNDTDVISQVKLHELELANEELQANLATHLDRLSSVLGVGSFNLAKDSIETERRSHHRWQEMTEQLQVPFWLMPSYRMHLDEYQQSQRRVRAPPAAAHFDHLVEDGNTVPVSIIPPTL